MVSTNLLMQIDFLYPNVNLAKPLAIDDTNDTMRPIPPHCAIQIIDMLLFIRVCVCFFQIIHRICSTHIYPTNSIIDLPKKLYQDVPHIDNKMMSNIFLSLNYTIKFGSHLSFSFRNQNLRLIYLNSLR